MLADTPIAFTDTLERARTRSDAEWQNYAARGNTATSLRVAAVTPEGRWVGTMGAYKPVSGDPILVGVYVSPDFRGSRSGVTDALLDAVERWVRERASTLTLLVHEHNLRAQTAYRKRGFELTGRSEPYTLNPAERDLEMSKSLP